MLNICETAEVKRIFSGNDIDIRTIGQQPTVVFLVMPDNVNTYTWITSMFYTQMFDTLIRLSDDEIKGPLPYEVQVWMDEFYAGARPADTTGRTPRSAPDPNATPARTSRPRRPTTCRNRSRR